MFNNKYLFLCSKLLAKSHTMKRIAIFASGNGTNAENIIRYFKQNTGITVEIVLSNHVNAKVLERSQKLDTPSTSFSRNEFYKSSEVVDLLKAKSIDLVVLAGFMWLVPEHMITAFPNKIINIHPALLPKYGGKGMYGAHVHKAVSQALETSTGITIHFVNNKYDDGDIIFQESVNILAGENPDSIAEKIHILEHRNFPKVIEDILSQ